MGKSASKLKKRRSQSMAWSFRFSTLNKRKMTPIITNTSHPHMEIDQWLKVLELSEYETHLRKFNGVEELMFFCEADIKQLGVKNSAHRARIVSSLVALRDKWQRGIAVSSGNLNRNGSTKRPNRYSLAVESTANRKSTGSASHYEVLEVDRKSTKQSKSLGDLLAMESGPGTPQDSQEAIALKKALEWELSLDSRDLKSHAWYHGPIPRTRAEEIVQKDGDFLIRDCVSQPGNYVLTCKAKGTVLHFVINKILIQPETVYERTQYQFEDDAYDTVADLITFYVGSEKSISAASGAKIQYPCNRMYPLSFYVSKYGAQLSGARGASPLNSPSLANAGLRYNPYKEHPNYNSFRSPTSSPPRTKRETPPRLPSKKQKSQPLQQQSQNSQEKYNSADGVIQGNDCGGGEMNSPGHNRPSVDTRRLMNTEKCSSADGVIQKQNGMKSNNIMTRSVEEKSTSADGVIQQQNHSQSMSRSIGDPLGTQKFSSPPRTQSGNSRQGTLRIAGSINRDSSDPSLSPCLEQRHFGEDEENQAPSPPPKPSRTPSMMRYDIKDQDQRPIQRVASYHASGSDSGNGSGDSAQSSAAGDPLEIIQHRGVIIKNPKYIPNSASSMTLKSFVEIDPIAVEESLLSMDIPVYEQLSKFDLENYQTLLLPSIENKPLDNGALNTFRRMLSETGPRILANYITRVDIRLILGDIDSTMSKSMSYSTSNPLETTGIELITLDHGRQFRRDLIERTECLKLLVATTILTCKSDSERAETLNKWIQVAIDTKTALGNLFGFSSIMLGLCMPQIQRLETTWHSLRQKFTDSAFNFEAKLKPTLKCMNDCSNPQAPNTTVPHLLPYILLKDRGIDEILGPAVNPPSSLVSSTIAPWEMSASDFGLTILLTHLDSARSFIKNLSLYKRNAQIILNDQSRNDDLLEDAFRTEFHIKFLWGSKGAFVSAEDRHAKFEQILTVMAEKYCSGDQINAS